MSKQWMTVTILAGLLAGALLAGRSTAAPETSSPSAVAVCDIVDIFNQYDKAEALLSTLNARREAIQTEANKQGERIQQQMQMLQDLSPGESQYEKVFQDVQRMRFQREAYLKFQEALALREHSRLTQEMYQEILNMIEQVAASRGAEVVLFREPKEIQAENTQELLAKIERRKVLYWSPRVDITATVLDRLNKAYGANQND